MKESKILKALLYLWLFINCIIGIVCIWFLTIPILIIFFRRNSKPQSIGGAKYPSLAPDDYE